MTIAFLSRKSGDKQTTSQFIACDGDKVVFECKMLEPPNKGNKPFVSCIPVGDYWVEKTNKPTYGECFEIKDVVNRDNILIHWGNYYTNTEGCLICGNAFKDINNDGLKDVIKSKDTFDQLMEVMPDKWMIIIREDVQKPHK